ncbi:MAG: branched-chain amino acid ABC transporter permease [Lautropia sp.]
MQKLTLVVWVAIALATAAFPLFAANPYQIRVGTVSFYYFLLVASWSLLFGRAGQFSLAHVAIATIGAYVSIGLSAGLGLPVAVAMPVAAICAALLATLLAFASLRLTGIYLALLTLAFAEGTKAVLRSADHVTGGARGLFAPYLFEGNSNLPYYYLGMALVIVFLLTQAGLLRTRARLYLAAIRHDQERAKGIGIDVLKWKSLVFAYSGAWAGLAGAFLAHFQGIVSPDMLDSSEMALVMIMAMIGGITTTFGPALATIGVRIVSEMFHAWSAELGVFLIASALVIYVRLAAPNRARGQKRASQR